MSVLLGARTRTTYTCNAMHIYYISKFVNSIFLLFKILKKNKGRVTHLFVVNFLSKTYVCKCRQDMKLMNDCCINDLR